MLEEMRELLGQEFEEEVIEDFEEKIEKLYGEKELNSDEEKINHYKLLAYLELLQDNDEEALEYAEKILSINNNDVDAICIKGDANFGLEEDEEAIKYYEIALKGKDYSEFLIYYRLGYSYFNMGEGDKAEEYCKKALENAKGLDMDGADAEYILGEVASENEEYGQAVSHYLNYLKFNDEDAYVFNATGECYESLENYEEALKCFAKAVELDDSDEDYKENEERVKEILEK